MHGLPVVHWNSAKKAAIETVARTRLFFHRDQFKGSFGSSEGCGIKTVRVIVSMLSWPRTMENSYMTVASKLEMI
jgi:hypothetical protein